MTSNVTNYHQAHRNFGWAVAGFLLAVSVLILPPFFKHDQWSDVGQALKNTFSNNFTLIFSTILTGSALTAYATYRLLREREEKGVIKKYTIKNEPYTFKEIYQCEESEMVGGSLFAALLVSSVVAFTFSYSFSPGFRTLISGTDLLRMPAIVLGATSFVLTIIKLKDLYEKRKLAV